MNKANRPLVTVVTCLSLAAIVFGANGQNPTASDPALTESLQPDLVKMVPSDRLNKPFVVAVALGSPPDDFRDSKGEIAGWEIDIMRAATEALGLKLEVRPHHVRPSHPGLASQSL